MESRSHIVQKKKLDPIKSVMAIHASSDLSEMIKNKVTGYHKINNGIMFSHMLVVNLSDTT